MLDARLLNADIGVAELQEITDSVALVVETLKRENYPANDSRVGRLFSQKELAENMGVSRLTVARHLNVEEDTSEGDRGPKKYNAATLVELREKLRLTNYRGKGDHLVTIPIVNFKGGVSKSTVTAHAAHYLALKGYRVLAIDGDPQGSLSTLFGLNPEIMIDAAKTLFPFLAGDVDSVKDAVIKTHVPTLSVLPANIALAQIDMIVPARIRRELAKGYQYQYEIKEAIQNVESDFDVVLIDCPPTMSYMTTMALEAADGLIIPLRPSSPDLASSKSFMEMFTAVREELDRLGGEKKFKFLRFLITQTKAPETNNLEELVRMAYAPLTLTPTFVHSSAVTKASEAMTTIYDVERSIIERRTLTRAQDSYDRVFEEFQSLISSTRKKLRASAMKVGG